MRFPSWRATQPQDPADRAKLQERLTRLTTPPVLNDVPAPPVVTAPISPARAKLQELTGAGAPASARIEPVAAETTPSVEIPVPAPPVVTPEPVLAVAPIHKPRLTLYKQVAERVSSRLVRKFRTSRLQGG